MDRHVFRLSYGYLSHEGRVVKETDKTFMVEYKAFRSDRTLGRRVAKTSRTYVVATDKPEQVVEAFRATQKAHEPRINELRQHLQQAAKNSLDEAFKAAGIDQSKPVVEGMSPTETET